jgi:chromosome segregation ATPase
MRLSRRIERAQRVVNAKMLNKILAQAKTDAARIKDLEGKLAVADASREEAREQVLAVAKQEMGKLSGEMISRLEAGDRLLAEVRQQAHVDKEQFRKTLIEYQSQLVKADEEIGLLSQRCSQLEAVKVDLSTQLQEIEPKLALYEQQKLELTQLCDKVRDRMRRKELAEESAILNRKAATFKPLAPQVSLPRSED